MTKEVENIKKEIKSTTKDKDVETKVKEVNKKPKKTVTKNKKQTKPKVLKLSQVKKESSQVNKRELFELENGTAIEYNPVFAYDKIEELFIEYQNGHVFAQKNNLDFFDNQRNIYFYLLFLAIKYFTHFEKELSNDFESQIIEMNHLIKTGYFTKIVDEVFNPKEVNKIIKHFEKWIVSNLSIIKMEEAIQDKTNELDLMIQDVLKELEERKSDVH